MPGGNKSGLWLPHFAHPGKSESLAALELTCNCELSSTLLSQYTLLYSKVSNALHCNVSNVMQMITFNTVSMLVQARLYSLLSVKSKQCIVLNLNRRQCDTNINQVYSLAQ